uniref:Isopenicillin N synthase-like Fe(2+) 2OG dioxygenase domain-containing protein n=1 Tax=Setaria digitata TaxID=48799 RepID=A0A915PY07_9BILA
MAHSELVQEKPSCGCKGIRFCALCKDTLRVLKLTLHKEYPYTKYKKYVYSTRHRAAVFDDLLPGRPGLDEIHGCASKINESEDKPEDCFVVAGLHVVPDFLSKVEEMDLVDAIDKTDWILSQSGRRKQDYGPRVNFKHKKVKLDRFSGMPVYTDLILNRMKSISSDLFGSYQPFELCNLEYSADRCSAIEMHCDDTWIWGERLIWSYLDFLLSFILNNIFISLLYYCDSYLLFSINLLSNSVLTYANEEKQLILYVPLPRRTMICMSDEIRYSWRHAVFPEHIRDRRIALTMREPSAAFKEGGELYEKFGREITRLGNIRI